MAANGIKQLAVKEKKKKRWKQFLPVYVMILPGLLYLLINNYFPMFGVIIAFKKLNFSDGIFGSPWSRLDNFKFLFATNDAWVITRNTILYNVAFFIVGTIAAIAMAILLNEIRSKFASKAYQSVILLPYLMSWVVVSYLGYAFLSSETGLINNSILEPLGKDPINWYMDKTYWPLILILVNTWKGIGYSMIIYLASIVGINQDYYEAATIDGASKWKQIKHITIPLLKPTFITLFILSVGQIFRSDFGLFYQMPQNSGALYSVTRTLDVYVYQALLRNSDYGMSSAASFYQSIVGFILILAANFFIKKYNRDNALF
ncbi:ABC transporter permease [Paenibacillus terreus]|uniref:ABC transporter permease n=1 Tax=Paenibacillus terreus TaxID=1387834 RepID=A0ABV5BEE0_9BACL